MDHDRKVCPRCGEPTAGYGFCPPCRAHIDSLTGGASSATDRSTAQVLREVVRLEQALADASKGMSDRAGAGPSTTAVDVDSAPEGLAEEGSLDIAKLQPSGEDMPPRPDVARLEDVLTVQPPIGDQAIAPKTAAVTVPEVDSAPSGAKVPASGAKVPASDAEVPASDDQASASEASVPPPEPRSVAPPSPKSAPRPEPPARAEATSVAPPEAPAPAELPAAHPSYVAAHVLRAAFWFEQTSAFESRPDDDVIPEPIPAAAPELDPARHAATSVPPPSSAPTPISAPPPPQAEPLPAAETAQRSWITALCLLALIALVVVLTGRRPCRCDCHKSR